jgi:hypothetical protein
LTKVVSNKTSTSTIFGCGWERSNLVYRHPALLILRFCNWSDKFFLLSFTSSDRYLNFVNYLQIRI